MEINEIKKFLYKNNPVANFLFVLKETAVYQTTIIQDNNSVDVFFNIPISEMGDAKFAATMDSKFLNRWIVN